MAVQPVHGDLHVGQVLEWPGGLAVIDFDGNPTLSEAANAIRQPRERDVAQMLTSLDHVGRVVEERGGGDRSAWIAEARAGFLAAIGPVDEALLAAFEVEQECRELVYADRFLPRWRYAPMATLRARFGLMDPTLFLADLEAKPASLARLADAFRSGDPLADVPASPRRVLLVGMGSSRYAAGVAALRLRAAGIDAVAEYASATIGWPPAPDTLVVAISASGESEETIATVDRYRGTSPVVALTDAPRSTIATLADVVVPLEAGEERGGVACRSFQHTLLLLRALEAQARRPSRRPARRSATASPPRPADLLDRRAAWLPEVAAALDGPDGVFVLAPVERLASAEQGALIIREGPRRPAVACETGDWSHVDVYLAKTLDYRALLFAGSRWDGNALEWLAKRGSTVVAVGGDLPGARAIVRYAGDDDPEIAAFTEVLVPELLAGSWWAGQ